jgi:hypothetical protein
MELPTHPPAGPLMADTTGGNFTFTLVVNEPGTSIAI